MPHISSKLQAIRPWHAGVAIALVFFAIALMELGQHGLALDAPALYYAGDRNFYWLGHPSEPLDFTRPPPPRFQSIFWAYPGAWDVIHYPAFPGLIASATSELFAVKLAWLHPVQAHDLGLDILHCAGLFLFTVLAWGLLGPVAGCASAICYLFYPTALGHAFTNPKDLPCTDFYACSLLAGAAAAFQPNRRNALITGALFGVALSCKINALIGLANWLVWLGLYFALDWWHRARPDWRLPALAAFVPAMALPIFIVLWPYLYAGSPGSWLDHLAEYWRFYADYAKSPRATWTAYPLRNVLYMSPPLILVLAAVYLFRGARWNRPDDRALPIYLLILSWTSLPILRLTLPHSNFYDANRHFMEYIGGLCTMAGCGAALTAAFLQSRWGGRIRWLLPAAATAATISLLLPWLSYRPYEASYYNFLIGGLGGAQRQALNDMPLPHDKRVQGTEGDYWYTSVADTDRQLAQLVPEGKTLGVCGPPYPTMAMQWFGPGFAPKSAETDQADYVWVAPREAFCGWAKARKLEAKRPVLVRVERGGGLIYEILGPEGAPHAPVSPRTAYERGTD
jgi:hypothetical protein